MKTILKLNQAHKIRKGLFNIDIVFPGLALHNNEDSRGLAQLGRFDVGHLYPGVFVDMHLHKNDEILSYLREGQMIHQDNQGSIEVINNQYLMMMNAGSGFYHQEEISKIGNEVKMLQIFIRPEFEDEIPKVQFYKFENPFSINVWRLIAGHKSLNPNLEIRSHVAIWDTRLVNSTTPLFNNKNKTYLLYIFSGKVKLHDEKILQEGDSLIYKEEEIQVTTIDTADLVLFELDETKNYIRKGMFSGT